MQHERFGGSRIDRCRGGGGAPAALCLEGLVSDVSLQRLLRQAVQLEALLCPPHLPSFHEGVQHLHSLRCYQPVYTHDHAAASMAPARHGARGRALSTSKPMTHAGAAHSQPAGRHSLYSTHHQGGNVQKSNIQRVCFSRWQYQHLQGSGSCLSAVLTSAVEQICYSEQMYFCGTRFRVKIQKIIQN